MEKNHKVSGNRAYCVGGWSESLAYDLKNGSVLEMELAGDWSDLSCFEGLVDSVEILKISGLIKNGSIKAIDNICVFKSLKSLILLSKINKKYDLSSLPKLENIDAVWQADFNTVLQNQNLNSVIVRSLDPSGILEGNQSTSVKKLWLSRPKIGDLTVLKEFPAISSLRLTDCHSISTLSGVEDCNSLQGIDVENAKNLEVIDQLTQLKRLKKIRLMNVSDKTNLVVLKECMELEDICIGGSRTPNLPWELILSNTNLKRITGWWRPDEFSLDEILECLGPGRQPKDIDQIGSSKRPLLTLRLP